ncbi:hypothetical protein MSIMFB_00318 [Mycobacterium simulans]|uniref:Mce protein n=1 Tax=Mycobacterium simulans TaxID=627089 RepID=A0A7Z7II38_9MYCO|nr:Mce protein [Mycobacterium simulans]SOJ52811.1 hypothetical protein MSIMFB_00318 [Mycobacterium simulans]
MEGDAGASRLNPTDADDSLSDQAVDESGPEATGEDSSESEVGADQTSTEATGEDSSESEVGADQVDDSTAERGPSRLGRGWLAGVSVVLLLIAGAIGAGGYFAWRSHQESQDIARYDAQALQAAKDCVAATQAPDTNAMAASEQKIIECGTDTYRTQALLYSSMLVQAYQASNVHVQVSDMRAAVERNNTDGSVDVLVALRVKVNSDQVQGQETGYRLRVRMTLADGQYKISKLDQVTK